MTPSEKRQMKNAISQCERDIVKIDQKISKFEEGSFVCNKLKGDKKKIIDRKEVLEGCLSSNFFTLHERY